MSSEDGGGIVSRFQSKDVTAPEQTQQDKEAAESVIISELAARKSVLPAGSAFDEVAGAVLAANSRTAEAELRAARLRSEAASKNWLPSIGPSISLTSLGDFVASIFVEQVLFDNGRKKAERAFAKADVEVAAVALADATNDRVFTALSLYLDAAKARESAALAARQLDDMGQFEWIMNERVKGGISDMSDLNVLRAKLAEIRSEQAEKTETASAAIAELNAMSITPLGGVRGLSEVHVGVQDAQPLDVLKAEAEKERSIAQATMDRAGHLPGVKATGTAGSNGSDFGISASSDQLLGFGTGASLKAIEMEKETANRRIGEAREETNRKLSRLEQRLTSLSRQVGESSALTQQAKANLDLFQEQYEAGQRQVMDVVGVYETFARRESSQVGLKYEMALTRLEIARILGLLADGSEI